jgi:hypothetical protein
VRRLPARRSLVDGKPVADQPGHSEMARLTRDLLAVVRLRLVAAPGAAHQ